jgi:hypothetical protein
MKELASLIYKIVGEITFFLKTNAFPYFCLKRPQRPNPKSLTGG